MAYNKAKEEWKWRSGISQVGDCGAYRTRYYRDRRTIG